MKNSIRRKIARSNRKLLRPTRIAIFTCSVFFVVSLMLSNFFALSMISSFLQKLNRADYVVNFKNSADYSEIYKYGKVEKILDEGLDGVEGAFVFSSITQIFNRGQNSYILNTYMSPKEEKYSPFNLLKGNLPQNDNEIVIPYYMKDELSLKIGDEIDLSEISGGETTTFKISGISYSNQDKFVYDGCFISENKFKELANSDVNDRAINTIALYTGGKKLSQEQLADIVSKFDGNLYQAKDTETALKDELSKVFGGGFNPVSAVSLVFVSLAIGVGCMVISNTFRVLIARQKKTIALLRTVGATKKQIYRMVLQDAFSLGLVSSFLGALIPLLLVKLAEILKLRIGNILIIGVVDWSFLIYPTIVLTIFTLLSVISSAKIATQVSPLEALRPNEELETIKEKKKRGIFNKLLLVLGLIGMGIAWFITKRLGEEILNSNSVDISSSIMNNILFAIVSSFAVFIAIVFSARRWFVNILKLLFKFINKRHSNLYLASANILRNPRRTSITAAALLIGIIMVSTILTAAASANATFDKVVTERYPIDLEFQNVDGEGDGLLQEFRNNPKLFPAIEEFPTYISNITKVGDKDLSDGELASSMNFTILASSSDKLFNITQVRLPEISEDEVLVGPAILTWLGNNYNPQVKEGDLVSFELRDGKTHQFKLKVDDSLKYLSSQANMNVFINADYAEKLGLNTNNYKVMIKVSDKVSSRDIMDFISKNTSSLSIGLNGSYMEKALIKKSIDSSMYVLFALISTTIIIAIIGIANTLILSVIERRRETSMLRVIGMTKPQIKKELSYESLLISLISITLGIIIGIFFGCFGIYVILYSGLGRPLVFSTNIAGIIILLVLGVLAAWISSIAPSREALKSSPIEALGNE